MEKIDLRKQSTEEKEVIRKRAIIMFKKGINKTEIASSLGVHRNSVRNWILSYKSEGSNGLKSKKTGFKTGEGRLLSPEQEKLIIKKITDKMPEQLKLPYALWTRKAIKELIKRQYSIDIAIRTMGDYLHRWGFTPQKPKKRAYEQNDKAVNEWLNKTYPLLVKKAKKEDAEIHWGDETGIRNTSQYGRSYAPIGKTPVKLTMAKRLSINMISTVTNQGKVRFMTYKGTMNAQRLIVFLKRLIKEASKKIFLILDNLKVHHSNLVKQWTEKNINKIELVFLPSYSPELNPDEYLNNDLKSGIGLKPAPKNDKQIKSNVKSHMMLLQKNPDRVARYFNHKSIKYAAA